MLSLIHKWKGSRHKNEEDGFTIVEIMVAAIIVAMVLLFSAAGITSAVKTTTTLEARSKATNLAASVIAIAQQTPYRQLWVNREFFPNSSHKTADYIGASACDATTTTAPTGTAWSIQGEGAVGDAYHPNLSTNPAYSPLAGLIYCTSTQFGTSTGQGVGIVYHIQTNITFLSTPTVANGYDTPLVGAGSSSFSSGAAPAIQNWISDPSTHSTYQPQMYYAKRVVVTVKWSDLSNAATAGSYNTVSLSYTAAPDPSECVPATFNVAGARVIWNGSIAPSGNPAGTTPDIDNSKTRSWTPPKGCTP